MDLPDKTGKTRLSRWPIVKGVRHGDDICKDSYIIEKFRGLSTCGSIL